MRITFVSTGDAPIPPSGYGGVELVIWNIRNILVAEGHRVHIVNVPDRGNSLARRWRIVREINASAPDVVHIHASKYFSLACFIRCSNILLTDHSPGVSFAHYKYHRRAKAKSAHVVCFSERIKGFYAAAGIAADHLHVVPNGVAVDEFAFAATPKHPDRSICLGAISRRKRQYALAEIAGVDFAGPMFEPEDFLDGAHQGEWSRQQVCGRLTDYANLILLSKAEVAAALVCLEALAAGLGLVISETNIDNLDTELPFIDVVPESKIHDRDWVAAAIHRNRAAALPMRKQIREYARENFDTKRVVKTKYLPLLAGVVGG